MMKLSSLDDIELCCQVGRNPWLSVESAEVVGGQGHDTVAQRAMKGDRPISIDLSAHKVEQQAQVYSHKTL
jgi:hypothetical protein